MTDKEIIIDGVDVSQCVYRMKDEYNTCCCTSTKENEGEERITAYYGCKYNHNCHYKQLKRKEQECYKHKLTLDIIEEYCMQCNLRWDFTAQLILNTINKLKDN